MTVWGDPTLLVLKKALEASSLRHRVIADNVANADTPRFKKSKVVFEELLKEALSRDGKVDMITTDPRHMKAGAELSSISPQVVQVRGTAMRADGNNVDIEEEMVEMAANAIRYQVLAREAADRFSLLSYVITGGRR